MFDQIYVDKTIELQKYEGRNRRLNLSGARNFRDLGGYRTTDGRSVRWGLLYRSDALHKLTSTDLKFMAALNLDRIIDFRSAHEKASEPDRLPAYMKINYVEIPIHDASTRVWHESRDEFIKKVRELDPTRYMVDTNVELATQFTPEIRTFFHELSSAGGRPVLFHCAAGKDRTGFAAAVILRLLGVPEETVMEDYLLTNQYFLPSFRLEMAALRLFRGKKFADGVLGFMKASPEYLSSAFIALEHAHGTFENYVRDGLGLTEKDIERFRRTYLE